MSFHKNQKVTDYRPGDIVFFNFSGRSSAGHVGICESWDGTYITTIDATPEVPVRTTEVRYCAAGDTRNSLWTHIAPNIRRMMI